MGCCCSKRARRKSGAGAFGGEGNRLGTADEQRDARAARAAAAEKRQYKDEPAEPYVDDQLTDEERANIREERLAAVEGRLTKQEKKAMKTKKKSTSDEPLRGPNSQNTMRWNAS